ncbi:MAG: nucleotide sugar dehydrogenase, partial [Ilumatobacteraceae bacterium]
MSTRIAVIGTGYVGLTTGVCLAHLGHQVVCADIDEAKVQRLAAGQMPIVEDGLGELLVSGLASGRLSFVVGAATAAAQCEMAFLCVPTPQGDDGSADLSYIEAAAREIASVLPAGCIVVNKSTVPVGSTKVVEAAMGRSDVRVVSNPEFLREGSAVRDFLHPDRVVVGSDDRDAAQRVAALYEPLGARTIITDPASAETIKYAATAFLATKLSFINAVAAICEGVGADINDVVAGIGSDSRIGSAFLQPGPGWGGSCFAGEETVLVEQNGFIALRSFSSIAEESDLAGLRVLSWDTVTGRTLFSPVTAVTSRPFEGTLITVFTKMGRRLTVTDDHLFVAKKDGEEPRLSKAAQLCDDDWIPLAVGRPTNHRPLGDSDAVLIEANDLGVESRRVFVRLADSSVETMPRSHRTVSKQRLGEIRRSRTSNLLEAMSLSLISPESTISTVTNGTFVPVTLALGPKFWEVVGLYLAEGHISTDGRRRRIAWSFHPTAEDHLVELVQSFWNQQGVKASIQRKTTSTSVSISSRLLAHFFEQRLGLGSNCYDHRIPDEIWRLDDACQRALLRGLWLGDGSWSFVNGGPSVVLEYGTVSRNLADGMIRLLATQGIVARLKIGRTAKSTCDTYWLVVSGADQIRRCEWLLDEAERPIVLESIARQAKQTRPAGFRIDDAGRTWVRVTKAERRVSPQTVYSVEVEPTHTVVTSFGLVAHNCFPKDSRAMVKIADDAGYTFDLLAGVITVNEQQYD